MYLFRITGLGRIIRLFEDADILRIFFVSSNKVAVVSELIVWVARWLRQAVVTRVKHDVSFLVIDDNLESEEKQAILFVDVICNRAELSVLEPVWDLLAVDFKWLSLPVLDEPAPVFLVLLIQIFRRAITGLDDVADESDQAWTEAALGHETELDLLDTNNLIFLDNLLLQGQVIVEARLWL